MAAWLAKDDAYLGEREALVHRKTKETCLFGRYGEIWEASADKCAAMITSPKVARKYLPENKWPVNSDDEVLFQFPIGELEVWAKRLGVPRMRITMLSLVASNG